MSAFQKIASVGLALVAGAFVVTSHASAASDEFDPSKFTCLNYTNGMGANSNGKAQATIAHMWMAGFLTGYYKAAGKLEWSDEKGDTQKLETELQNKCKESPQNSVHAVTAQAIAQKEVLKLPKTIAGDVSPETYTCGQHIEAKAKSANKADIIEMWAFAVIEGSKAVAQPELEIPPENKAPIIGALNRTCGNPNNKDTLYLNMAAAVANSIKMN